MRTQQEVNAIIRQLCSGLKPLFPQGSMEAILFGSYARAGKRTPTPEAQARDRVKERKARTRRLIQEGALLEKHFPAVKSMGLDELEYVLQEKFT